MRYLNRSGAAQLLVDTRGIRITAQGLADHAHRGTGPKYAIINGRALYTEDDPNAWIAEQAARPVMRRTSAQAA